MAQEKIIIKFKAQGSKELIAALKNLKKAQDKLLGITNTTTTATGKAAKASTALGTRNKRLAKTNSALSLSFATLRSKLLLVSFAMSMGVRQIMIMAKESAKLKSMGKAFDTLSGGVNNSSLAMDRLQKATNGTMSQFDLFQQANNAMILGVSKNSEEMAEMFDIAQRLGRALGRDTKFSVESLITGIGRQSRMMLDNIGIIVKAEEAYKKHAKTLNKTVDQLTDVERKQAFLNATMESARKKVSDLGAEVMSAQDSYDRLQSSIKDTTIAFGSFIAENLQFSRIADTSSDILDIAKNMMEFNLGMEDTIKTSKIATRGIDSWFDSVIRLSTLGQLGLSDFKISLTEVIDEAQRMIDQSMLPNSPFNPDWKPNPQSPFSPDYKPPETIQLEKIQMNKRVKIWADGISAIGAIVGVNSKNAKALANIQALASAVDAFAMAQTASMQAAKNPKTIPFPAYPAVIYGITLAKGLAQAAATKAAADKMEQGGLIGGRRHSQGGTMINAEQGEFVMSRNAVESVGIENLNRMNQGGGGAVTVNVSGNVLSQDFVEGELAENIKEAVRRGTDFGIS